MTGGEWRDTRNLPPSVRALIAGRSEAGKSAHAWKWWLKDAPRKLILDFTGEWHGKADAVAVTVEGVAQAMRDLAPRGRWTIVCQLDLGALDELVRWLVPLPDVSKSPIIAVGGAVLFLDEIDVVASSEVRGLAIRTLFRRSRHAGLSIVATSQRPETVTRELKAQLQQLLVLAISDVDAMDWCIKASAVRDLRRRLPQWTAVHEHGGVWVDLKRYRASWVTDDDRWSPEEACGELVEPVTPEGRPEGRGAPVPAPAPARAQERAPDQEPDEESDQESESV